MKSRGFLVSLLAGAITLSALTAGEPPRPPQADDPEKVDRLREAEREQPLGALMRHCRKMLDRQIAVYNDTRNLQKVITGTAGKTPRPEDRRAALKLAADVKEIVAEATRAIDLLEAEGSAAAFREVFEALREHAQRVRRRLEVCDVGDTTQAIEQDIIDTLQEMIKSSQKR
jgi:hypothetical protein